MVDAARLTIDTASPVHAAMPPTASRRVFLQQAGLLSAALATTLAPSTVFARALTGDGGPRRVARLFDWRRVSPRVWQVVGNGGNSTVVADGADVLLVDTKELGYGAALRAEVAAVVGRPVTHVVSTHAHADHALGNVAFTRDVPVFATRTGHARSVARAHRALTSLADDAERGRDPFVAHQADMRRSLAYFGRVDAPGAVRAAYEALVTDARAARVAGGEALARVAARFAPTELFDAAHTVRIGRLTVELHHVGPAHTDNDVFVVVPGERVVITGDLIFHGLHPFIDVDTGGDTVRWERALDAMTAAAGRTGAARRLTVLPGHGAPVGPAGIDAQRAYFGRLREIVGAAIRDGRSRAEVIAMTPAGLPRDDVGLGRMNLGVVYDELQRRS
jgi:cyclase